METNESAKNMPKWGSPEQLASLRGIFKHEDEIWPEGYVQLWIPNDFNHYAICIGYKGTTDKGRSVLVAGIKNPFGKDVSVHLPGDEYKYWCELPKRTKEMEQQRQQDQENGIFSHYNYGDGGLPKQSWSSDGE